MLLVALLKETGFVSGVCFDDISDRGSGVFVSGGIALIASIHDKFIIPLRINLS